MNYGKEKKADYPGEILDEDYIKPLRLNLQKLADRLGIARNTLFKIRAGEASVILLLLFLWLRLLTQPLNSGSICISTTIFGLENTDTSMFSRLLKTARFSQLNRTGES